MEIARVAYGSDWPLAEVFGAALMAAGVGRVPRDELPLDQLAPDSVLFGPWRAAEPLAPREHPEPVDATELAAMLKPGGAFSAAFPGYEFRPPQVDMLEAVAGAFNQGHHLMVEAGTGTGKSVAYLLPAIAYAAKNNARVVISTNTINLQDQLFRKDLPDLERVSGATQPEGEDQQPFRAALLKGRSNYLCPRRFSALKARPNPSHDELRGIARILVWLPRTQTGDQGELRCRCRPTASSGARCRPRTKAARWTAARGKWGGAASSTGRGKQAEAAHVIVVNHALLMADAATENRVLPEYHHLVIDEAHHLEDAVTDQLSFKADGFILAQLFNALYPQGGRAASAPRRAARAAAASRRPRRRERRAVDRRGCWPKS